MILTVSHLTSRKLLFLLLRTSLVSLHLGVIIEKSYRENLSFTTSLRLLSPSTDTNLDTEEDIGEDKVQSTRNNNVCIFLYSPTPYRINNGFLSHTTYQKILGRKCRP